MTIYNVHIYREMRLLFERIEADTPEAAATAASDKPSSDADDIEDCNGDDLAALVDVAGDEDYCLSVTIEFEAERQRKSGPKLLAALKAVLPYAEAERASLCEAWRRDRDRAVNVELHACDLALGQAADALAETAAAGIVPAPADIDVHALLAERRQIADIWSTQDVQSVRPDLTDDQAWDVLQTASRRYDAAIGINWDVLRCHADDSFPGKAPEDAAAEG